MNDGSPLIEDHSNRIKFACSPLQFVRRIRVWSKEDKSIPLMRGVGIHDIRCDLQLFVLGTNEND
jgi:hypothetical protein